MAIPVVPPAGIPAASKAKGKDPTADGGLLRFADATKAASAFIAAVAKHRHFDRQTDPPLV